MSIRSTILAACLALTSLTGLLGIYAQIAERRLGDVALGIYDNTFMSMSYLREAQVDFSRLADEAAGPSGRRSVSPDLSGEMLDDLDVVSQRALSPSGRSQADALHRRIAALLADPGAHPGAATAIRAAFDRLVETLADDGFRYRQGVSRMVEAQRWRSWAAICASLLAALAITALVNRLIAPPVRRAVRIAQAIAAGRLDNPIAVTGRGETADLLRALLVMQTSLASGMARIQALIADQAASHAGEIAAQHAQMQAALANMNQGLCLFGDDGRLKVVNQRFGEMFGVPALGDDAGRVLGAAGLEALLDISRGGAVQAFSCALPDGRSIAVSQQAIAGGGWVATYEDVSERLAAEQRLSHMARHDLLTGLPNRLLFGEQVRAMLADLGAREGITLLCLELDRFKAINETLGHPVGDELLRAVAERLRGCVGKGDLVVRVGGDEFAIVRQSSRPAADQAREAGALAQHVIDVLAEPFQLEQHHVVICANVGIALCQPSADGAPLLQQNADGALLLQANADGAPLLQDNLAITPEALLKRADLALCRARSGEPGRVNFFETAMDTRMQARRMLEQDLHQAVAEQQFELFYQPLMQGGRGVCGFEALLRWSHPIRGLVSPGVFIPLAEEIGLIQAIGKWALRQACAEAAGWPAGLKVAVNLSPLQFRANLVDEVADALASSGLPPGQLELEITESVLLQDDEKVLTILHAIRARGVRIAMDDFGTGYSSLGYLRRFPFDKIKIDQSFVRGMIDQEDCLAIVRAVIGLGRSLGIAINAEGVETMAQREALIGEGCGELQGFLFSRPRPAACVGEMLRQLGSTPRPLESQVQELHAWIPAKARS